jgi:N-carbamoyl-L-amino-acid hydrolase
MNRRDFVRLSTGAAAALGLPDPTLASRWSARTAPVSVPAAWRELRVDSERLNGAIQRLGEFGALPGGGVSRPAFTEADREARSWTLEWMAQAGLEASIDAAGNLVGRREGACSELPPLMIGSHIDSVPQGGIYDGPVGSLAAIEVARRLHEEGARLNHPLEVLVFSNEEAGKTGSRAMAGEVNPAELALPSASAATLREGLAFIGGDPDRLDEVVRRPGDVAGYLELHIEQGGVLEAEQIPIGVVEGIVGIRRWNVRVEGMANHAGTTPMPSRRDALVAAARLVDAVYGITTGRPGAAVATVGRIEAVPGAPNVIPGEVRFTVEIRDLDMATIDELHEQFRAASDEIGAETGTAFSWQPFYLSRSALMTDDLELAVESAAHGLGLATRRMPSGAGHDAQSVARFAPAGMIFVPSRGGISHSPDEYTSPQQIGQGADVLLQALLTLDARGA